MMRYVSTRILWPLILVVSVLAPGTLRATQVQLLTCYPGAEFFQLEGHTGLRIIDPDLGDYVVNWGIFDFNTPNFAYRYTKGETDYMAGAAPTVYFLQSYRDEGRCVVAQTLNLDSAQARKLINIVNENLRPENRVYRYNYVRDNCATRPLRLIESAVGDTLTLGSPAFEGKSFRDAMRHYHARYPWYQFGIDLALGSGIDQPITTREMSFSPVDLERLLAGATMPSGAPVVKQSEILTGSPYYDATLGDTPWYAAPMFVCFCFMFITLLVCWHDIKHKRLTRWWDTLMYGILGLAGCLVCFLVFVSVHEATSPNFLLLWLNPLNFIAAAGVWSKRASKLVYCYQIVNFALILTLCVVLLCGIQQGNPAFWFLIGADAARSITVIHIYRCSQAAKRR